jgi:hypothetical protein
VNFEVPPKSLCRIHPTSFSEIYLNFNTPELAVLCASTTLSLNVRMSPGVKTPLEQWTGPIGQIFLHEGLQKRTIAKDLLLVLSRLGKRYDMVKDIVSGKYEIKIVM